MKFGMRRPSLRKMIAARLSPVRYLRHRLGLKAPRWWGWVFHPRRTAFQHLQSRIAWGLWGLLKKLLGRR